MNPRLFGSEEVSSATDIEVLHGDMDAAAQFAEALDSLQTTSTRNGVSGIAGRHKQIAERLARRAAASSSQLMQFAQAEVLGIVDDDGVDIGHVDTALYDGCGEEHVVIVVGEVDNSLSPSFSGASGRGPRWCWRRAQGAG